MYRRTWKGQLDERPFELCAEAVVPTEEILIRIDGFPATRHPLPVMGDAPMRVDVRLDGHEGALYASRQPGGYRFELSIDGFCVETGRPEQVLTGRAPADAQSLADIPARLPVGFLRYYRFFPQWPTVCITSIIAAATLGGWGAFAAWSHGEVNVAAQLLIVGASTALGAGIGWWIADWARVKRQFRDGDARPGVVVGTQPLRVAVTTDLGAPARSVPVVRVISQPVAHIAGRSLRIGDRVLTTCAYTPGSEGTSWCDVVPILAWCGTDDVDRIQRVLDRFSEEDWAALDRSYDDAGRPTRPGLYTLATDGVVDDA